VPVLRLFGILRGKKCCVHVHGVYPYMLVPSPFGEAPANADLRGLARELDSAIHASLQRPEGKETVVRGEGIVECC